MIGAWRKSAGKVGRAALAAAVTAAVEAATELPSAFFRLAAVSLDSAAFCPSTHPTAPGGVFTPAGRRWDVQHFRSGRKLRDLRILQRRVGRPEIDRLLGDLCDATA